jgi:hypothetical protein
VKLYLDAVKSTLIKLSNMDFSMGIVKEAAKPGSPFSAEVCALRV